MVQEEYIYYVYIISKRERITILSKYNLSDNITISYDCVITWEIIYTWNSFYSEIIIAYLWILQPSSVSLTAGDMQSMGCLAATGSLSWWVWFVHTWEDLICMVVFLEGCDMVFNNNHCLALLTTSHSLPSLMQSSVTLCYHWPLSITVIGHSQGGGWSPTGETTNNNGFFHILFL